MQKADPKVGFLNGGGARRDRTVDLLHAMQALSQLSYSPVPQSLCAVNGAHNMKPAQSCQRLN